jgi:DMSO reductase anchor subunit
MNEGQTASRSRFHEAPLVVFSALIAAGAGTALTHLLFYLAGLSDWTPPSSVPRLVAVLLGIGLLVSMAHLGRPGGISDALRGTGRSPLSNEVVALSAALGGAVLSALLPTGSAVFALVWTLTLTACGGTLFLMGVVYQIPGRPGWGGSMLFHPAIVGMIAGWFLWRMAVPGPMPIPFFALLVLLVIADLGITVRRVWVLEAGRKTAEPEHPSIFQVRYRLLILRGLLLDLLPFVLAALGQWRLATLSLGFGVLLDRTLFYGLALQETTEAEIERVEGILRSHQ